LSNEDIRSLVNKAKKFLDSSKLLLNANDYDSTVSRIYYAMFFSTEALLLTKNLAAKSHSGLISIFGEHFIKTNVFPKEMGRQLNRAYDKRLIGDYGTSVTIEKEETQKLLEIGKNFVNKIIKYLGENNFL